MNARNKLLLGVLIFLCIINFWRAYLIIRQESVCKTTRKIPREVEEIIDHETFEASRQNCMFILTLITLKLIMDLDMVLLVLLGLSYLWDLSRFILNQLSRYINCDEIKQTAVFISLYSMMCRIPDLLWNFFHISMMKDGCKYNSCDPLLNATADYSYIIWPFIVASVVYIYKKSGDLFLVGYWLFNTVEWMFYIYVTVESIISNSNGYLPVGELRTAIEELANRVNFSSQNIFVYNESSYTNAAFVGIHNIGAVVVDTMLSPDGMCRKGTDPLMTAEIVAVVGHELGHWKLGHATQLFAISRLNLIIKLAGFAYLRKQKVLYSAFGFPPDSKPIVIAAILFEFVVSPYNELLDFLLNFFRRWCEFEADAFSKSLVSTEIICSALVKSIKLNIIFPVDDWLFVSWFSSHPTIVDRIRAIRAK